MDKNISRLPWKLLMKSRKSTTETCFVFSLNGTVCFTLSRLHVEGVKQPTSVGDYTGLKTAHIKNAPPYGARYRWMGTLSQGVQQDGKNLMSLSLRLGGQRNWLPQGLETFTAVKTRFISCSRKSQCTTSMSSGLSVTNFVFLLNKPEKDCESICNFPVSNSLRDMLDV